MQPSTLHILNYLKHTLLLNTRKTSIGKNICSIAYYIRLNIYREHHRKKSSQTTFTLPLKTDTKTIQEGHGNGGLMFNDGTGSNHSKWCWLLLLVIKCDKLPLLPHMHAQKFGFFLQSLILLGGLPFTLEKRAKLWTIICWINMQLRKLCRSESKYSMRNVRYKNMYKPYAWMT